MPLRSAATGFGTPALINDCAPMMLRVRPAQLTMIRVAGFGASCRARSTSSAPGTLMLPGMFMVWYSSKRRASSTTTSASRSSSACTCGAAQRRRMAHAFHQFAERLARHVDVLKQLAAGFAPALQTAFEQRDVGIAQFGQTSRGAFGEPFAGVEHDDRHRRARQAHRRVQFEPRQRQIGGKQRMTARVRIFLAHIDERDFLAFDQRAAHVFE